MALSVAGRRVQVQNIIKVLFSVSQSLLNGGTLTVEVDLLRHGCHLDVPSSKISTVVVLLSRGTLFFTRTFLCEQNNEK